MLLATNRRIAPPPSFNIGYATEDTYSLNYHKDRGRTGSSYGISGSSSVSLDSFCSALAVLASFSGTVSRIPTR